MRGQLSQDAPEDLNRFSFGPRFGFNFKADFHDSSPAIPGLPGANIGSATGGVNHGYDDGYVNVDSSGNAGGRTWNWGYQNSSQVVGDMMQFHSTQSQNPSLSANAGETDEQSGLEVVYQRVLGHLPVLSGRWGLESGFGYTDIELSENRTATGLTTVTTDSYQLNGVLPPGAGYRGTFNGPGALLGDSPSRSAASFVTTETSRQELTGSLYTFRLGPFAEWNLTTHLSLAASVGVTLAPASIDYNFSTTLDDSTTAHGHSSKTGLLYGPYVGDMVRYDFTKHWGVFLGAQFQSLTDLERSSGTHSARLIPARPFI